MNEIILKKNKHRENEIGGVERPFVTLTFAKHNKEISQSFHHVVKMSAICQSEKRNPFDIQREEEKTPSIPPFTQSVFNVSCTYVMGKIDFCC